MPGQEWWERAACVGQDPVLWFPTRGHARTLYEAARTVCNGCAVRAECLDECLREEAAQVRTTIRLGMRGAMSPEERDREVERRRRVTVGAL